MTDARDMETTRTLLSRIREGDAGARGRLLQRYLVPLSRWAQGRLPRGLRDMSDTDDLVQNALLRALDHLDRFVPSRKGAFFAYLRRILLNQIRDEIRRAGRRPRTEELGDRQPHGGPSPLEIAIGAEALQSYEAALGRLTEEQRAAMMLRIELGFTHQEVADALGCRTANAARMLVSRALVRMAEEMDGGGPVDAGADARRGGP